MSKRFDELVAEALAVEKELRALSGDKPSLRCFISECLTRAGTDYGEVEEVKEKLAEPIFGQKSGCSAFIRDLSRQIANGRFPTPPEAKRIGGLYFNQKDEAVMELGGAPRRLFSLWIISAELAHHRYLRHGRGPFEAFGTASRARSEAQGAAREDLKSLVLGQFGARQILQSGWAPKR